MKRNHHGIAALGLMLWSKAAPGLDRWEEITQAGLKLQEQGRTTEAEDNLRAALRESEKSGEWHSRLANSFHNLGAFLHDHGKYPEAESFIKRQSRR
jgi:hypothetical protein